MSTAARRPLTTMTAVAAWLGLAAAALGAGCDGPKYPTCENDEQCNADGHVGFCVSKKCVECRTDKNCRTGEACTANACVPIPGFCDASHVCPEGSTCGPDNRCQAVQEGRGEAVRRVRRHARVRAGGSLRERPLRRPRSRGPGCTDFPALHFDYESPDLRSESRSTLERLAQCLLKGTLKSGQVLLTGHCDNRGEQEFNMSLGEYRAEAVRGFLVGLGVAGDKVRTSSRGELDASGVDEAGWANDRRVDIEVR